MLFARCSKIVTLPTPWCTNILVPILSDLYIYFKHHFISFLPNKSYNWRFISISINSLKLRMKYRCNKHSETSLLENVPGCERAKCGTIWSFVSRKRNRRRSQSQRTNRMESCPLPLRTSSSEPSWECFHFMALHLQSFLGHFQTDKPMVPFLYSELHNIVKTLLKLVLKPEVLTVLTDCLVWILTMMKAIS